MSWLCGKASFLFFKFHNTIWSVLSKDTMAISFRVLVQIHISNRLSKVSSDETLRKLLWNSWFKLMKQVLQRNLRQHCPLLFSHSITFHLSLKTSNWSHGKSVFFSLQQLLQTPQVHNSLKSVSEFKVHFYFWSPRDLSLNFFLLKTCLSSEQICVTDISQNKTVHLNLALFGRWKYRTKSH